MSETLRIVVTRPVGQAQGLCDNLTSAGFSASAIPVLEILPAAQPAQVLEDLGSVDDIDLMIFVSTNAVRFALDYLPGDDLPNRLRSTIAAVGPSTARALDEVGLPCTVVPNVGFSSEALLEEPALLDVQDKQIVIFRGDGGRALLGDTLRERGATVRYCEVYRRRAPASSTQTLQAALDANHVDLITATSVETLVNIEEMAGDERSLLLHNVKVVTASERVVKKALELGYTRDVLLANAPDDAALVAAITDWQQNARAPDPAPETNGMANDPNATEAEMSGTQDADTASDAALDDAHAVHEDDAPVEPMATPEPPPPQATAPKGGRGIALLALLLAVLAAALSAFSAWKSLNPVVADVEDPTVALESVASSLRSDVQSDVQSVQSEVQSLRAEATRSADSLRRDIERQLGNIDLSELDTVVGELESVADEQTRLARRLSGQERSITTVSDRLGGIETSMNAMQGVSDSVRNTWVRAEAEYFLQTANSRLQLAGDVASALEALRAADERIGALGDPSLIPIRAKITEEILAVEGVAQPDVEGMALTLIGMTERVPSLPLALEDVPTKYDSGGKANLDDKSGWARVGASISGAFSNIVRVTPADGTGITVLPPEDAFFILRNLELHLNVARLALMRQQNDNFHASVKNARDWLALYYDTEDGGVQSMLSRLETLEQTPIDPPIPDISSSLRMLRTLAAASSPSP